MNQSKTPDELKSNQATTQTGSKIDPDGSAQMKGPQKKKFESPEIELLGSLEDLTQESGSNWSS
ncbi:MAG: hypothetical protein ACKOA8_01720 [Deltaproteobacteria bacterium]